MRPSQKSPAAGPRPGKPTSGTPRATSARESGPRISAPSLMDRGKRFRPGKDSAQAEGLRQTARSEPGKRLPAHAPRNRPQSTNPAPEPAADHETRPWEPPRGTKPGAIPGTRPRNQPRPPDHGNSRNSQNRPRNRPRSPNPAPEPQDPQPVFRQTFRIPTRTLSRSPAPDFRAGLLSRTLTRTLPTGPEPDQKPRPGLPTRGSGAFAAGAEFPSSRSRQHPPGIGAGRRKKIPQKKRRRTERAYSVRADEQTTSRPRRPWLRLPERGLRRPWHGPRRP